MKKAGRKKSLVRVVAVGFVMTLILCGFLCLGGLAIQNTAQNLFGRNTPLMRLETGRTEQAEFRMQVLETTYEVDLSGANEVAKWVQKCYPMIPRLLRFIGYLGSALWQGVEELEQKQEQKESDGKILC